MATTTRLRQRLRKEEDGFSLIELMVVVLIMGTLMAIAVPTYLNSSNKSKDKAVQSNLKTAMEAAKTIAADNGGNFVSSGTTAIVKADMDAAEPSLSFGAGTGTASTSTIAVFTGTNGADITFVMKSAQSGTAKFYAITSTANGAVKSCYAATEAAVDTNAECVALSSTTGWTN